MFNKKEYMKKYRKENKVKTSIYNKNYLLLHHKRILEYKKKYRKEHKAELINYRIKYYGNRDRFDVDFKIRHNLRNRIIKVLKGINKSETTLKLLGCSVKYLKQHLESTFQIGMTWDNYGKWHIDHIRPCASFDLSKESEQKKCFHYSNLQPLWAKENLSKKDKI